MTAHWSILAAKNYGEDHLAHKHCSFGVIEKNRGMCRFLLQQLTMATLRQIKTNSIKSSRGMPFEEGLQSHLPLLLLESGFMSGWWLLLRKVVSGGGLWLADLTQLITSSGSPGLPIQVYSRQTSIKQLY